jgi:hypothetical protein
MWRSSSTAHCLLTAMAPLCPRSRRPGTSAPKAGVLAWSRTCTLIRPPPMVPSWRRPYQAPPYRPEMAGPQVRSGPSGSVDGAAAEPERERPAKPLGSRRHRSVVRVGTVADPGRGYRRQGGGDPVPARAATVAAPGHGLPADLYREGGEDRVVMGMPQPAPGGAHSIHRQGRSNSCRCRRSGATMLLSADDTL